MQVSINNVSGTTRRQGYDAIHDETVRGGGRDEVGEGEVMRSTRDGYNRRDSHTTEVVLCLDSNKVATQLVSDELRI